MKIWIVEYLDGLLSDSNITVFNNENDARIEFNKTCKELQFIADDEPEQIEDDESLFIKEQDLWWLSGEVSTESDLLVRISSQDIEVCK